MHTRFENSQGSATLLALDLDRPVPNKVSDLVDRDFAVWMRDDPSQAICRLVTYRFMGRCVFDDAKGQAPLDAWLTRKVNREVSFDDDLVAIGFDLLVSDWIDDHRTTKNPNRTGTIPALLGPISAKAICD